MERHGYTLVEVVVALVVLAVGGLALTGAMTRSSRLLGRAIRTGEAAAAAVAASEAARVGGCGAGNGAETVRGGARARSVAGVAAGQFAVLVRWTPVSAVRRDTVWGGMLCP